MNKLRLAYILNFKEKSNDYEDPNAYLSTLSFKSCYDMCLFNSSCLAISWKTSICKFITDLSNPIKCSKETTCTVMFGKNKIFKIIRSKLCFIIGYFRLRKCKFN